MKGIIKLKIFICAVLITTVSYSQNIQGFNYQALLLNDNNKPIKAKNIDVRISLYDNISTDILYQEKHNVTTTEAGAMYLIIGQGSIISGQWEDIKWESKNVYMRVEFDENKTNNYILYSQSELLSVPYALYADKAGEKIGNNEQVKELRVSNPFYIVSNSEKKDTLLTIKEGKIGIGITDPKGDVELGLNKRLHLSSDKWHLDSNGVITFQALNNIAKPSMTWYDEFGKPHAALTMYDRSSVDPVHQKEFAIETDDGKGNLLPRLTIPYERDFATVNVYNSDFKVNGGTFSVGDEKGAGKSYLYGDVAIAKRLGVGDKDWTSPDAFSSSNVGIELYKNSTPAELLVKTDSQETSSLSLQRGESKWSFINKGNLFIKNNEYDVFTLSEKGDISVEGEINTSGALKAKGKCYAMYFEIESSVVKGDVVGINPLTGKGRIYVSGDSYIGVAGIVADAGLILNNKPEFEGDDRYALVIVMGEIGVAPVQVDVKNSIVSTKDGLFVLGVQTSNNIVLLR